MTPAKFKTQAGEEAAIEMDASAPVDNQEGRGPRDRPAVTPSVTHILHMSPFCQISLEGLPAWCHWSCPEIIHHFSPL